MTDVSVCHVRGKISDMPTKIGLLSVLPGWRRRKAYAALIRLDFIILLSMYESDMWTRVRGLRREEDNVGSAVSACMCRIMLKSDCVVKKIEYKS